ncbi:hypothetical protein [Thermococcus sp.]|uniref:DNA replication complex subunit Gins51 n=1 Tax=Thermococcus sp. TaxID=35749 RepID=UPI002619D2CE|nr:hypothetical protein [Thermococcus sp.]
MDIVKLRELLEEELSSSDLTKLGEEFYREFDSLIKALKLGAESSRERGEDVEERLYLAQLEIAERLAREIIKIRLHKIVDLAVEGLPGEMTAEERRILTILRAFIERREVIRDVSVPGPGDIVQSPVEHPVSKPEKSVPGGVYIITTDLPKVLDPDLKEYGPFRAWDMAILPEAIGRVLVERDAAIRVKLSL